MSLKHSELSSSPNKLGWRQRIATGALAVAALTACTTERVGSAQPTKPESTQLLADLTDSDLVCAGVNATKTQGGYLVTARAAERNGAELREGVLTSDYLPVKFNMTDGSDSNEVIFSISNGELENDTVHTVTITLHGDGLPIESANKGPFIALEAPCEPIEITVGTPQQ